MLALLFALIALCGPLAAGEEIHTQHGLHGLDADADACEREDCALGGEFAVGTAPQPPSTLAPRRTLTHTPQTPQAPSRELRKCYLEPMEVAKAVSRAREGSGRLIEVTCLEQKKKCLFDATEVFFKEKLYAFIVGTDYETQGDARLKCCCQTGAKMKFTD
ncbi:unnamed protein product [Vitrella brassicaformis CCMP3155]|uniref:Phospholipid scramblase n=1 Tax=Vitrella brassicaformis (strain CCMP3155) TaxID=1169540 RepID=A0A0G4F9H5_VITBC|nr:unnamed protein product [Vitrella brassicaformis CCMP3155]|eukprot:CEM09016.1 unnamed protein product [Vitrella brassicaformis CCMP3155]